MLKIDKNKGQVLIEAIVAIAVIAFVLAGIVSALISAVNNSTFAKNQNIATNLAQEGIGIARDQKEIDFNTFKAKDSGSGTTYCVSKDKVIALVNPCPPADSRDIFIRKLYINQSGLDQRPESGLSAAENRRCASGNIYVVSSVGWSDSRCEGSTLCHKVELDSCFSDLGSSSL